MDSLKSEGRRMSLLQHWPLESHISCSVLEERARINQPTCRILPLPWIVLKPGKDICSAMCLAPYHSLREGWRICPLGICMYFSSSPLFTAVFFIPPCFSIAMYTLTVDGLFFGWFLLKLIEHLADRQLSRPCRVCFMT